MDLKQFNETKQLLVGMNFVNRPHNFFATDVLSFYSEALGSIGRILSVYVGED
jgi:hypothetical protein